MSAETMIGLLGVAIVSLTAVYFLYKKVPKRMKRPKYSKKWRDIQHLCAHSSNWPQAILLADLLLDQALKRKNKEGKTMGERMVAAQNNFSSNDSVWQAHKFANHIRHVPDEKLRETDVKASLIAYRQALRDLGAL